MHVKWGVGGINTSENTVGISRHMFHLPLFAGCKIMFKSGQTGEVPIAVMADA
jgi:hypothetical protein